MEDKTYNHKEAYCLMLYRCEKCGELEQLWNSRDGVTPFVIGCKRCGGEAVHIMWQNDKCMPDYKPETGQRIFIDMTKERAEEIAKKRIEYFNKIGYGQDKNQEELLNNLINDIWHNGQSPDIQTIKKSKAVKTLAQLMAVSAALTPIYDNPEGRGRQKERTIRKCADPKKKSKRKMAQASKIKNRR